MGLDPEGIDHVRPVDVLRVHHFFLDANVLFSAAYREGAGVKRLWDVAEARLVTSGYARDEAQRNLGDAERLQRLGSLLERVEVVEVGTLIPRSGRGSNCGRRTGRSWLVP